MARTMKWPPVTVAGRIPWAEGVEATSILIVSVLSDLRGQPFNDPLLSLGDMTFKPASQIRPRVENALARLRSIIDVQRVDQTPDEALEDTVEVTVEYTDRETRTKAEVTIHG